MAAKFLMVLCLGSICLWAQKLGENAKAGIERVRNKQFQTAIPLLEDAAAENPNNPVIHEYLGLAYLDCVGSINGTQCLQKAEAAMRRAIDAGGRATFIVDRSLERTGFFATGKNVLDVKRGWLHVTKTQIVFEPERPDAKSVPMEIPGDQIREYKMNSVQGKNTNVFHIKAGKDTYNFRTANFSSDEAAMLFRLMEHYFGPPAKK